MFKWLAAAAAAIVALPLALMLLVSADASSGSAAQAFGGGPTALATKDIPPQFLVLYMDAARTCPGLPWPVLAGIGKVESDHGRSHAPGVQSGSNQAGAAGPMQFLPATFAQFAVDGDHDGRRNATRPAHARRRQGFRPHPATPRARPAASFRPQRCAGFAAERLPRGRGSAKDLAWLG